MKVTGFSYYFHTPAALGVHFCCSQWLCCLQHRGTLGCRAFYTHQGWECALSARLVDCHCGQLSLKPRLVLPDDFLFHSSVQTSSFQISLPSNKHFTDTKPTEKCIIGTKKCWMTQARGCSLKISWSKCCHMKFGNTYILQPSLGT